MHVKGNKHASGQGLVEYALLLSLVAIIVAVVVTLLGEQIQDVFCGIVMELDENAPGMNVCKEPHVACVGVSNNSHVNGEINLEAQVRHRKGMADIANVKFYIDGVLTNTELVERYCLARGDTTCPNYDISHLSNGAHTIEAIAETEDGLTGQCSVTFTVSN